MVNEHADQTRAGPVEGVEHGQGGHIDSRQTILQQSKSLLAEELPARIRKTCDIIEDVINSVTARITGTLETFEKRTRQMWDNISQEEFKTVKAMNDFDLMHRPIEWEADGDLMGGWNYHALHYPREISAAQAAQFLPRQFLAGADHWDAETEAALAYGTHAEDSARTKGSLPHQPRTSLGKRLWEIRGQIMASGERPLGWDESEKEVSEQRSDPGLEK